MKRNLFNPALYLENLKRFWSISAITFFAYYLSGIDVIRIAARDAVYNQYALYYKVKPILSNQWFWPVFTFMAAAIAAFTVFNYLHKHQATNAIHAMPLGRDSLFITNYLSGLTLCLVPIVLTTIALFIVKTPTYSSAAALEAAEDIFTSKNILVWFFKTVVESVFTFSCTVFGLMVSGSSVIAAITGLTANFIVPIVMLCLQGYELNYWGYADSGIGEHILNTSPYFLLLDQANLGVIENAYFWFFAASIVIAAIAWILYKHRKNEKVEDAYAFKFFEVFIGLLFVFIPSTLTGVLFNDLWGTMAYVYGGLIGFVIGQMFTRKTFRILDKEGLRNLIAFGLVLALLICAFNFDFFGYEKYKPQLGEIKNVRINSGIFYNTPSQANEIVYKDAEDIQIVLDMHQDLIGEKDNRPEEIYYLNSVRIRYELNSGKFVSREYMITSDFFENSAEYKKILNDVLDIDELELGLSALMRSKAVILNCGIDCEKEGGEYLQLDSYTMTESDLQGFCDAMRKSYSEFDIDSIYKNTGLSTGWMELRVLSPGIEYEDDLMKLPGYSMNTYNVEEVGVYDDLYPTAGYSEIGVDNKEGMWFYFNPRVEISKPLQDYLIDLIRAAQKVG